MLTWWEREAVFYQKTKENYEGTWKEVRKWKRRAYWGWGIAGMMMLWNLIRR